MGDEDQQSQNLKIKKVKRPKRPWMNLKQDDKDDKNSNVDMITDIKLGGDNNHECININDHVEYVMATEIRHIEAVERRQAALRKFKRKPRPNHNHKDIEEENHDTNQSGIDKEMFLKDEISNQDNIDHNSDKINNHL